MSSNINVKHLSNVSKENFYMLWLDFLKPYHKLRRKEMEILALLLIERQELTKVIKDDELVDSMLLSRKIRNKIKNKMGYSSLQSLTNMISFLRQKNVIVNDRIIKSLIPVLDEDSKNFKLIFNFEFK